MAIPWIKSVRDTKTLTIFDGIGSGIWANIFAFALGAFNNFAKSAGVKMMKSGDKEQANVVMGLGDGTVVYEYDGTSYQKSFSGTGLHGLTRLLSRDGVVEKTFVFLPARPTVTMGYDRKGNLIEKLASQDVMKIIAVHELIHASGLENSDHGGDGIFYYPLAYQSKKLYVPERGKNMALMPPIRPDARIVGKIKELW
jgi:hypothetical protein